MPSYRCKLCDEQAEDVALHLTERHGMNNERELFLVVCLIKGRKLAPVMQCPVPGCSVGKSSRLERHLDRIHRVDNHQRARFMEMAHRKAIVYELRALRETFPDPPMVSDIDMCHCVLINMTADEVSRAVTSPDGFRVISVKRHKTAAFFGRAKIALSPQEYTWLTDTIRHRETSPGSFERSRPYLSDEPSLEPLGRRVPELRFFKRPFGLRRSQRRVLGIVGKVSTSPFGRRQPCADATFVGRHIDF
ncbi:hypothetical protein IRJ41_010957 [Triplophysa rosa]|uniref:Uncharacterized protein n=1 Tax=Triplophysa rosa TaxID=992332 RepID=A0A9W7W7M6_TRIRA|nr:hypothetical protein IRJ41_010957 [Triplophysa rosa]